MNPEIAHACLMPAVRALFPGPTDYATPGAQAMLLTIPGVESGWKDKQQLVGGFRNWWDSVTGPAAGLWQCERIGIRGVMEHHRAGPMLRKVCERMDYPFDVEIIWQAIRYDVVLAVAVARLILWIDPEPLPGPTDVVGSHRYYLRCWRPGKPCTLEKWAPWYAKAWRIVLDDLGENGGAL